MDRRHWLRTTGAAFWSAALGRSQDAAKITIRDLEIFTVKVNRRGNWVLFRLTTNKGLTGIGEASHSGADDLACRLGKQFAKAMAGRGIFDIEWLREDRLPEVERRKRPAAVAFSGIEQCLWDLQGKSARCLPAYKLFGGMLRAEDP